MSPLVCRLLVVATVALFVGLVVMGAAALFDLNMLPAALLWASATAAWCYALHRCVGAPTAEDLR